MNAVRVENRQLKTIDFVTPNGGYLALRVRQEEKSKLVLQIGSSNPESALLAAKRAENDI